MATRLQMPIYMFYLGFSLYAVSPHSISPMVGLSDFSGVPRQGFTLVTGAVAAMLMGLQRVA